MIHEVNKIFKQDDLSEKIVGKTQETILMDGETIILKILSRLQTDSNRLFIDLFIFSII